jgi:hypothetical protein
MKIRCLAALLFVVAISPTTALAQDAALQSYDVELIIFRVSRPSSSPENWAVSDKVLKNLSVSSEEETATTGTVPPAPAPAPASPVPAQDASFPALNASQFRMNAIADSLRRGKNYQPLAHIGWTQPGYPVATSPKFSLQNYLPGFLPEGIALTGEVSLSRGPRLLHLLLDLSYRAPDGQRYVLRETRRMRSTEKHYVDHPYFGVIALVTPRGGDR